MMSLAFIHRLKGADRAALTKALTAMTAHTDSLPEALRTYAADPANRRVAPVLHDLCRRMEDGATFSEALDAHAGSFPPAYRCAIRAGEERGDLRAVLQLLDKRSTTLEPPREMPLARGPYLAMLLVLCWAVLEYLLQGIVPMYAKTYEEFGRRLPGPTALMVNISNCVSRLGIANVTGLILVALGLGTVGRWLRRRGFGWSGTDYLLLRLPGSGRRRHTQASVEFSRALGLMLATGVPVPKALGLAGEASHNVIVRNAAYGAAQRVADGATLAAALSDTGFFAPFANWLWRQAEDDGHLADSLLAFADAYEQPLQDTLLTFITLPVVFFLFAFIAFVLFSLYLPVFTLGGLMSAA